MLIKKTTYGYSQHKKHITGRGFVDTMSSVFNSIKSSLAPAFRNVSSYVSTNRDLIAKPLLGAIGSLAATGLTAGVPALISHIANRNKNRSELKLPDDPKYKEILQTLVTQQQPPVLGVGPPVSNIIGSGNKGRKHRGAGIKTY
jgi:hypothetical protein